jgi:hypothetical protein
MYVIKKSINDAYTGHDNLIWQATYIEGDLTTGRGILVLDGWKDETAYEAGLRPSAQNRVDINMRELTTFESVWAELATKLLNSDPLFNNGELVNLNRPQR